MNADTNTPPTNSKFKKDTGVDIEYIKGLNRNEVIEVYRFLTQTEAGRKFARNTFKKDQRLQNGNRRLGTEKKEIIVYADRQITQIKNESDKKLINIISAVKALLTKPITQIKRQDIKAILTLIEKSLWS